MANKTERFTTVWDGAGVERRVRWIDAREIVDNGGSFSAPKEPVVVYTEAEAIAQNDGVDDSTEAKKKKAK